MKDASPDANILKTSLQEVMKPAGFAFKSGAWYRKRPWAIQVVNLQKSQYGKQYYLNLGVAVLRLGATDHPKENQCHARIRADSVDPAKGKRLKDILDLETEIESDDRQRELSSFLEGVALPFLDRVSTLEGVRDELSGALKRGMVQAGLRRMSESAVEG